MVNNKKPKPQKYLLALVLAGFLFSLAASAFLNYVFPGSVASLQKQAQKSPVVVIYRGTVPYEVLERCSKSPAAVVNRDGSIVCGHFDTKLEIHKYFHEVP